MQLDSSALVPSWVRSPESRLDSLHDKRQREACDTFGKPMGPTNTREAKASRVSFPKFPPLNSSLNEAGTTYLCDHQITAPFSSHGECQRPESTKKQTHGKQQQQRWRHTGHASIPFHAISCHVYEISANFKVKGHAAFFDFLFKAEALSMQSPPIQQKANEVKGRPNWMMTRRQCGPDKRKSKFESSLNSCRAMPGEDWLTGITQPITETMKV